MKDARHTQTVGENEQGENKCWREDCESKTICELIGSCGDIDYS